MTHELKIISGFTTLNTKILIDDKPIGYIQKVIFSADIHNNVEVELVFPDLMSIPGYVSKPDSDLEKILASLKDMPNVKVTLQKITSEES
jgi:hypothetical protein